MLLTIHNTHCSSLHSTSRLDSDILVSIKKTHYKILIVKPNLPELKPRVIRVLSDVQRAGARGDRGEGEAEAGGCAGIGGLRP